MSGVFVSLAALAGTVQGSKRPPQVPGPTATRLGRPSTRRRSSRRLHRRTQSPHYPPQQPAAAAAAAHTEPTLQLWAGASTPPRPARPPRQPSTSTQEEDCSDSDTWSQLAQGDTDELAAQLRAPANANHDGGDATPQKQAATQIRQSSTTATQQPCRSHRHNNNSHRGASGPAETQLARHPNKPEVTQPPTQTLAKTTAEAKVHAPDPTLAQRGAPTSNSQAPNMGNDPQARPHPQHVTPAQRQGGPQQQVQGQRAPKRSRYTNAFGEVIRQLRLLGGRLPSDLTDEDLATNMSVAKAYVDVGLDELQRHLGDQGGLQIEEAQVGGATAAKEPLRELPAPEKVRQLCHQLGDLLPFLVDDRAREARGLLGALLEWVQTSLGTTVSVDSQGGVRNPTQPVARRSRTSCFGGGVPSTACHLGEPRRETAALTW